MNKNIQTEVDACYLYQRLAENETEETIANVFRQMSEIEKSHAEAFLQKQKFKKKPYYLCHPSGQKYSTALVKYLDTIMF